MGKKIIVFTTELAGHHLEYIHHIHEMAVDDSQNQFVFLLPSDFEDVKEKFKWRKSDNVSYVFFSNPSLGEYKKTYLQQIGGSYHLCRLVSHYQKKIKANVIYANSLIGFVPFAPLILRNVDLCGIIYRIYLYDIKQRKFLSVFLDKVKFFILSKCGIFKTVFILNDTVSSSRLNFIYNTNKFITIPDPYVPISAANYDFRLKYGIDKNKVFFIQFGALNEGKSTIEVLKSIQDLSQEEKKKYAFAFCGSVMPGIKDSFYCLYEQIKKQIEIVVIDEFCDYELFGSLCKSCDAILTPYTRTSQSSGLIGYASQFGKPVIATDRGLLGEIVRKYKLGYLIKDNSSLELRKAYKAISNGEVAPPDNQYNKDNSVRAFQYVLSNNI